MNQRPTLDPCAFERLLVAACVLQRQHGQKTVNVVDPFASDVAVKDISQVLLQKEEDLLRVRQEIEALRRVISLLADENTQHSIEGKLLHQYATPDWGAQSRT